MANTTFHPEQYDDYPLLDLGKRENGTGSKMVSAGGHIYPIPAVNESGGGGSFTSAEDYAKLLAALLRDDSKILKKEMIEELVKPQLNEFGRQQLTAARQVWVLPDIPQEVSVDHALGGIVTTSDSPNGRPAGTMAWDGMSSPHWVSIISHAMVAFVLTPGSAAS